MYNESGVIMKMASGVTVAAGGVAVLPATNGNSLGMLLAYGAIFIGVAALIAQIVVRIMRHHYQARMK